jgi:hypothetical protein
VPGAGACDGDDGADCVCAAEPLARTLRTVGAVCAVTHAVHNRIAESNVRFFPEIMKASSVNLLRFLFSAGARADTRNLYHQCAAKGRGGISGICGRVKSHMP